MEFAFDAEPRLKQCRMTSDTRRALFGTAGELSAHSLTNGINFHPQENGVFGDTFLSMLMWPDESGQRRDWRQKFPAASDATWLGGDRLTKFGTVVHDALRGRVMVDLGSGDLAASRVPRTLALAWGAAAYVGIDYGGGVSDYTLRSDDHLSASTLPGLYSCNPEFSATLLHEEILAALTCMQPGPYVFYLGALEPRQGSKYEPISSKNLAFCKACTSEIARLIGINGSVIVGPLTRGFHFEEAGLKLIAEHDDYRNCSVSVWMHPERAAIGDVMS